MKIYKMSDEERKRIMLGKIKTNLILLTIIIVSYVGVLVAIGESQQPWGMILLTILETWYLVAITGRYHFELDGNNLSCYKRGKLKKSFDLKKVRAVISKGENESTLIIKDDGNVVGNYHSEILGITVFNELIEDISLINDGTYQS